MREILFRGKRKDNGKWVMGDLIHYACNDGSIGIDNAFLCENEEEIETFDVLIETVGQYIGLNDKNNQKIFEGDILSWNDGEIDDVTGKPYKDSISICVYDEKTKCFGERFLGAENICSLDGYNQSQTTVIGNIYDNPELLEGKQ